jgi:type VI secretion system secreted protein VgrG
MSTYTQDNRNLSIGTPLGKDKLLLFGFTYAEALGRLFELEADLLSTDFNIDFDQIVGRNVSIRLESAKGEPRFFNGYVASFVQTGVLGRLAHYRARIVPWLWFLTRTADCRIFQNKTVPEIIKEVFRQDGFTDFTENLRANYEPEVYCVQYRETDFNFVSRLMEREGIYYYFEHQNGVHKLVLADDVGSHGSAPRISCVYNPEDDGTGDAECVERFEMEQQVQSGVCSVNDFNFKTPKVSLLARSEIANKHDQSKFEVYDYPGEYEKQARGTTYSKIRIEELQAQHLVGHGRSSARRIGAGGLLTLSRHPRRDWNKNYLVTDSFLQVLGEHFEGSGQTVRAAFLECKFSVIDGGKQFRPRRETHKPVVEGPQTAIVVGPRGEEIFTDEYGRIKVQFHWDRYGKADENSSCWLRVSQAAWAGNGWGSLHIPRIGQEVIVEFLEGDPDMPIVTGRVYNGDHKTPYKLPEERTKSTLKSNSSKGGNGFNELRFEDKKGDEQVYLHAERNLRIKVKRTTREWTGKNRHLIVERDQIERVVGDKHSTVVGDRNTHVLSTDSLVVDEDLLTHVKGSSSLKIDGDQQEKVGGRFATQVGTEVHIRAGTKIILQAGSQISLKVGGNFIDIGPRGVTISGSMVYINSGGSPGSGAGSSPDQPGIPLRPLKPEVLRAGSDVPPSKTPAKKTGSKASSTKVDPKAQAMRAAFENATPFCEICQ